LRKTRDHISHVVGEVRGGRDIAARERFEGMEHVGVRGQFRLARIGGLLWLTRDFLWELGSAERFIF
jgi:hypothetical protein